MSNIIDLILYYATMHAIFWYSIFVKQLVFKVLLSPCSFQKNVCAACIVDAHIPALPHFESISRLAPHKLYISIAHEEQARTSTCKNHTPAVCISLLPQPLQAFSLDMMLISCLCSDDGRPIASSLTTIVVDATTSALLLRCSSCTGSAHFAHITTISSISWPFLPSIYAD